MRAAIAIALCLQAAGCAVVIGEDFEGYSAEDDNAEFAMPAPGHCNPVNPWDASGTFRACASNETCQYVQSDGSPDLTMSAPRCVPIYDTTPLADACEYTDECGSGAFCSLAFGCTQFCDPTALFCDNGQPCRAFNTPATAGAHSIGYCAPEPCEPVTSDCVGTCGFYEPERTACFPGSGTGVAGDLCSSDTDCQATLACDDASKRCTRYCRIGSNDCGAKECLAVNKPPLSYQGVAYGYCAL